MEGRVLAGRYRLISMLGQGGMGSVWRAEHLALGSLLAIKLIDPGMAQSPEAAARFKREAQAAADLRSAHVVQIIDYGVDEGVPFIAMELLDGESLGARLQKVGRVAPMKVASILSQVARALARAHQAGIVHRDLKPDNVFLVPEADDDVVKVLDFGIAKKLGALSTTSGIRTGTGAMLGTPYYMSPEQVLGQGNIDHRTDIWSLGIIAYECLTGERPFEKETLGALLMAICNEPLPIASETASVPSGFDAWFARACARDMSARFDSAIEATADLRSVCGAGAKRPSFSDVPRGVHPKRAGVTDWVAPQPAHGSTPMEMTAAPSSVTIPGLKRRWKPRMAIWALAVLVGAIAVVWLTGAILNQSRKRDSVVAATGTVVNASPVPASPLPSQTLIELAPSTPVAKAVDLNSPISHINDLPIVTALQAQTRRGSAPTDTPPKETSNGTPASSEAPEPPALASAAPESETAGHATLNVNSIPVSNVIVDGRPMGSTPKMGLSVTPGTHIIVFVHPEHGRKAVTVTVAAGQTQTAATRFGLQLDDQEE